MIPPFDERGHLPPGIHPATLDEIAERFGGERILRDKQAFDSEGDGRGDPMTLRSQRELEITREKLRMLEERLEESRREHDVNEHVQELSQRSLKRLINQLKEEIAWFEAHQSVTTKGG